MPLVVALFLAAKFVLYTGYFYLIARILDVGTPLDALRAGLHRTWLGAAATMASLVIFLFIRFAQVPVETTLLIQTILIWVLRASVWTWVSIHVYRVTRWRKGKLAVVVLGGLALNAAVDFALYKLQSAHGAFMPSFGAWEFRMC